MLPPHVHMSLWLISTAGMAPLIVVVAPGSQGEAVTGTQGIGVRMPLAAAVAAATVGLASDEQAPKGGMLATGMKALVFADGTGIMICPVGNAMRLAGATPKVHIMEAPMQTAVAIVARSLW